MATATGRARYPGPAEQEAQLQGYRAGRRLIVRGIPAAEVGQLGMDRAFEADGDSLDWHYWMAVQCAALDHHRKERD